MGRVVSSTRDHVTGAFATNWEVPLDKGNKTYSSCSNIACEGLLRGAIYKQLGSLRGGVGGGGIYDTVHNVYIYNASFEVFSPELCI